jgi:hypothetical protein
VGHMRARSLSSTPRKHAGQGLDLDTSRHSVASLGSEDSILGSLKDKVFWRRRRHGPCVESIVWPRLKKNFVGASGEGGLVWSALPLPTGTVVWGAQDVLSQTTSSRTGDRARTRGALTTRVLGTASSSPRENEFEPVMSATWHVRRRRYRPGSAPVARAPEL